ncbi:hypothetical protein BH20VER1_BH20VER1_25550 [soil metagenome]
MLLAFTGGPGTGYYTSQMQEVYTMAEELRALGFTIVQVRWTSNWLTRRPVTMPARRDSPAAPRPLSNISTTPIIDRSVFIR